MDERPKARQQRRAARWIAARFSRRKKKETGNLWSRVARGMCFSAQGLERGLAFDAVALRSWRQRGAIPSGETARTRNRRFPRSLRRRDRVWIGVSPRAVLVDDVCCVVLLGSSSVLSTPRRGASPKSSRRCVFVMKHVHDDSHVETIDAESIHRAVRPATGF